MTKKERVIVVVIFLLVCVPGFNIIRTGGTGEAELIMQISTQRRYTSAERFLYESQTDFSEDIIISSEKNKILF